MTLECHFMEAFAGRLLFKGGIMQMLAEDVLTIYSIVFIMHDSDRSI
jgi:hypothetical protein